MADIEWSGSGFRNARVDGGSMIQTVGMADGQRTYRLPVTDMASGATAYAAAAC